MVFTKINIEVDQGVAEAIEEMLYVISTHKIHTNRTKVQGPVLRFNPYNWFRPTFNRVSAAIGDLKIDTWWFNCAQKDDEYRWHHHFPYPRAAVLYIKVPPNSSCIEFNDGNNIEVFQPNAGDLILFPGELLHRVPPNQSDDCRISVAFNLK